MAFIEELYSSEVQRGTLREKLSSQIPHSFQNLALEWEIQSGPGEQYLKQSIKSYVILKKLFYNLSKNLFSILCSVFSPHIPNICSFYSFAHPSQLGTSVGAKREIN